MLLMSSNNSTAGEDPRCTTSHAVLFYKYVDVRQLPATTTTSTPTPTPTTTTAVDTVSAFVEEQRALCTRLGLLGRVLIGAEGINGALCCPGCQGTSCPLDTYITEIPITQIDWKRSSAPSASAFFSDLTVKRVNEIVATNRATVETNATGDILGGGKHLSPEEWHRALATPTTDKETIVIDVRNTFEHAIGTFFTPEGQRAIEPGMRAFTEWEKWCDAAAAQMKGKRIMMFCTGGIRCEKASAILKRCGVDDVSQLRGGIHRYLEVYPSNAGGLFKGRNFVFDHRVSTPTGETDASGASGGASSIVGRCTGCTLPFDELSGQRVCAVCRDFVVLCPQCALSLREYHCAAHQDLSTCFFSLLDGFGVEALEAQSVELQSRIESGTAVKGVQEVQEVKEVKEVKEGKEGKEETEATQGAIPRVFRNDTRIMKRQLLRIQYRIEDLRDGTAVVDAAWTDKEAWSRRCRSCGDSAKKCDMSRAGALSRCAFRGNRKIAPRRRQSKRKKDGNEGQ